MPHESHACCPQPFVKGFAEDCTQHARECMHGPQPCVERARRGCALPPQWQARECMHDLWLFLSFVERVRPPRMLPDAGGGVRAWHVTFAGRCLRVCSSAAVDYVSGFVLPSAPPSLRGRALSSSSCRVPSCPSRCPPAPARVRTHSLPHTCANTALRTRIATWALYTTHPYLVSRARPERRRGGGLGAAAMQATSVGTQEMKWVSSCQVSFSDLQEASDDTVKACKADMGENKQVDLAMVFISSRFTETRGGATPIDKRDLDRALDTVKHELGAKMVFGCLGGGVMGMGEEKAPEEFESFKAVSICCAHLPGVDIAPFSLAAGDVPGADATQAEWRAKLGNTNPSQEPVIIALVEPQMSASSALTRFLEGLDFAYPGCVKVGGLAAPSLQSASALPSVFSSWTSSGDGASPFPGLPGLTRPQDKKGAQVVGVALTGNIAAEPLVAQGCRGIGGVYEVAEMERNMLMSLTQVGKSKKMTALEMLQQVVQGLSPADVELAQTSLFLGVASESMQLDTSGQPPGTKSLVYYCFFLIFYARQVWAASMHKFSKTSILYSVFI
jgi:small ligand-binding sensory domain FIST